MHKIKNVEHTRFKKKNVIHFSICFSKCIENQHFVVVLLKEVPEGVENGQNALNKRCRA